MEDRLQQLANRAVFFDCMTQVRVAVNKVVIAATFLNTLQNLSLFQFPDEPERGPLRNANSVRDVAQPGMRVLGKADQHMGVITEERPVVSRFGHG